MLHQIVQTETDIAKLLLEDEDEDDDLGSISVDDDEYGEDEGLEEETEEVITAPVILRPAPTTPPWLLNQESEDMPDEPSSPTASPGKEPPAKRRRRGEPDSGTYTFSIS
jgi:hypothetical protein